MRTAVRALGAVLSRLRELLASLPTRTPVALATFVVLYTGGIGMRVVTYRAMAAAVVRPLSFDPHAVSLVGYLGWSSGDLLWAVLSALGVGLLEGTGRGGRHGLAAAAASAWVLLTSIVLAAHLALLFAMQTGFSWEAVNELVTAPSWGEIQDHLTPVHFVAWMVGPALTVGLARRPPRVLAGAVLGALALAAGVTACRAFRPDSRWILPGLRPQGAVFLVSEVADALLHTGELASRAVSLSERQAETLAFVDDVFADPTAQRPTITLLPDAPRPENLVLVMLESTGLRYVEEARPDGRPVMPFLSGLRARGLYALDHHATANSSASAMFSVVTGLFPVPETGVYAIRADLRFPGLPRILGGERDAFLVTPGRLESFFPRGLLANNGVRELWGYYNLPAEALGAEITAATRDERTTFSWFLDRIDRARAPFFAAYYTYAPHYDYNDYGPDYAVFPGGDDKHGRYLNNLVLVDSLLERLVARLEAAGRLQDTAVVLLGDHGEAFGQHGGNWTHSRAAYEENLHVPFVLLYPPAVPPQTVAAPTTHADVLPTLLDLFGVPYDPASFQGGSLVRPPPGPRRLVAWGNEGSLTTWRGDGVKVQVSLRKDRCRAFDLRADPTEAHDLGCDDYGADVAALLAWRRHQLRDVKAWNVRAGAP